ncbi:MAG: hypothetical protein RLZZ350_780 [Verrucomicrobiota bacterium]|jgi:hypothetical protein
MKPQETAPVVLALAPLAAAAPAIVIAGAFVCGLIWLFSDDEKKEKPAPTETQREAPPETKLAAPSPAEALPKAKRVMRDDVAEALAYGAKQLPRKDAVTALEALGFRKTAAYRALSPDGKFASLIEFTADGLIEWKG